jgi:hypothetical protein
VQAAGLLNHQRGKQPPAAANGRVLTEALREAAAGRRAAPAGARLGARLYRHRPPMERDMSP